MFKVKYILEQWTFAVYNFTAVTFATYENFFIVRYRYGCIHCRELGMKIGWLKCYLADEGDLLTLLEHPGHPADPSEDDPRHALPHGAQPLQVVQGDHQGHARCDLHWLTVQLSTAHILRAVLRPGPGQQLVFRAVTGGGICRSEATWQQVLLEYREK